MCTIPSIGFCHWHILQKPPVVTVLFVLYDYVLIMQETIFAPFLKLACKVCGSYLITILFISYSEPTSFQNAEYFKNLNKAP